MKWEGGKEDREMNGHQREGKGMGDMVKRGEEERGDRGAIDSSVRACVWVGGRVCSAREAKLNEEIN